MPFSYDLTGETLDGRYEVIGPLGKGGMGHVYAAEHIALEQRVAIKVLHPRFAHERRYRDRFMREARAASRIRHRNVVDIKDFGHTSDGSVYFVMEFLHGQDVGNVLKAVGRMPWPRVRHILLQAAGALQAAHESGIIHRDIKPGNCFLTREREGGGGGKSLDFIKLLDFGIAKVHGDSRRSAKGVDLTGTGEVFGTATYMSPEQARGDRLDPRTDIYSLGVMSYQMLAGRVPFTGINALHVISRHLTDQPESLRVHQPSISPQVDALVLKMLAKERDDRFGSMAALRAAIEEIPASSVVPRRRKTQLWGGVGEDMRTVPVKRGAPSREPADDDPEEIPLVDPGEPVLDTGEVMGSTLVNTPGPSPSREGVSRDSPSCAPTPRPAAQLDDARAPSSVARGSTAPVTALSVGALARRASGGAAGGSPATPARTWSSGSASTGPLRGVGDQAAETRPLSLELAGAPGVSAATLFVVGLLVVVVAGGSAMATLALLSDGRGVATTSEDAAGMWGRLESWVLAGRPARSGRPARPGRPVSLVGRSRAEDEPTTARLAGSAARRTEPATGGVVDDELIILESGGREASEGDRARGEAHESRHESAECRGTRRRARSAWEAQKWGVLRTLANESACWSAEEQRARLRLYVRSLLELQRFDQCIQIGRGSPDADVEMMVSECEQGAG